MTIDELVARVEVIENQLVKLTINTPRPVEPEEKPKKTVKKAKLSDEEKAELKEAEKKETKKVKKAKDPEKPKRPPSAYNMFCKNMRNEAKEKVIEEEGLDEEDTVPTTKVMQMLGKMWKELDEETQKSYKPVASSDDDE